MLLLPFSRYWTTIRQSLCQLTEVLGVVQISLTCLHFAFITNSSYVHVSSLEGLFLLGKEERCHQTTTFRNWRPSKVPVTHSEEHLTISIFNIGCHWLLYGAENWTSYWKCTGKGGRGHLSGMKRPGREPDRELPCSVDVNIWVHNSTPPHVFVMR